MKTTHEEVRPAFEILLESVETEVRKLNDRGAEAFKKRDYQLAKELAEMAERFASFRAKVLGLSVEWERLSQVASTEPADSKEKVARQNLGKAAQGDAHAGGRFLPAHS